MSGHFQPGDLKTVNELIQSIQIALFTTVDHEGNFHTRPLQTMQVEPEGRLWFLARGILDRAGPSFLPFRGSGGACYRQAGWCGWRELEATVTPVVLKVSQQD